MKDAFLPALPSQAFLYLLIAGGCLLVALRFMKRAIAPIGLLVHAAAAAAVVAVAIGAALVFLAAAAVSGH